MCRFMAFVSTRNQHKDRNEIRLIKNSNRDGLKVHLNLVKPDSKARLSLLSKQCIVEMF